MHEVNQRVISLHLHCDYCGCLAFAYSQHQRFIHFISISRTLTCISLYPQERIVLQLRAVGFLLKFPKVSGPTCFPQTPGPWDVTGSTRSNRVQRVRYLQGFLQVIQTFRLGERRWNRQVKVELDHVNSQGARKKGACRPLRKFFKYKSRQNTQLEAYVWKHWLANPPCYPRMCKEQLRLNNAVIAGEWSSWKNLWSCIEKGDRDRWWVQIPPLHSRCIPFRWET